MPRQSEKEILVNDVLLLYLRSRGQANHTDTLKPVYSDSEFLLRLCLALSRHAARVPPLMN